MTDTEYLNCLASGVRARERFAGLPDIVMTDCPLAENVLIKLSVRLEHEINALVETAPLVIAGPSASAENARVRLISAVKCMIAIMDNPKDAEERFNAFTGTPRIEKVLGIFEESDKASTEESPMTDLYSK